MIHPVVLCGGSGTRLWPSSRAAYPKQFIDLLGGRSLFQDTLARLSGEGFAAPLVLTNADFRFIATEQVAAAGLMDARVVIEPAPRNTAPAILTAALMLEGDPDALVLVAPSDHAIADADGFRRSVLAGAEAARAGRIVTFGVMPTRAETAYGYLDLAGPAVAGQAVALRGFVEKPDAARAAELVASGHHLWNAGIFLFRVADMLAAFEAHAPDMIAPCRAAVAGGREDLGFFRLAEEPFRSVRAASIDYAVMEKAANLSAVPMASDWSDLGSWDALWQAAGPDGSGVVAQGNAHAIGCERTFLRAEEPSMQLVGIGLRNVVAVAMRDAVLVADLDQSQRVREAVVTLQKARAAQATDYPRYHRPWGWYETLILGDRFQVKRIMVKPGGILSLQSHHHRAEHWVVVAGTAEVTVGAEKKLLAENQSVYIPLGEVHRMANPGKVPMYLIEVQTGSYLGEDDIVRYEDVYNRAG